MNKVNSKSKILTLALLPFVIIGLFYVVKNKVESANATGYRYGGLIIDTGVKNKGPIFTDFDFKPGDCQERSIKVKNISKEKQRLTVRSKYVVDPGNLSEALTITILYQNSTLYENSLKKFFEDSASLDGVVLDEISSGDSKIYKFIVCFEINSGNQYQEKVVQFDLVFGNVISPISLPKECSHLQGIITSKIIGSEKSDRIFGTHASELIIGGGGNDRVDGSGGHDCIITLGGNDRIDGGAGRDVIISGEGDDRIDGGSDDDIIYAGNGNDKISAGSGYDLVFGGEGDDTIAGDSGNDELHGENGRDRTNGNAGLDKCYSSEILNNCEIY